MAQTSYQILRDQILSKLNAITDFYEVKRYPKLQFSGYPAVCIEPSDVDSDYETNAEHLRVYAFNIYIFYENKTTGNDTALDRLYNVIDQVLNSFDGDQVLTGITMPAGRDVLGVKPTTQGWEALADNETIQGKILIQVMVSVTY